MDELKQLAHTYASLHKWEQLGELAEQMLKVSSHLYELRRSDHGLTYKRPLYAYILYARLLRAYVQEERGDHKAALESIPAYMDGSWVREDTEEAKRIIAQYQDWGRANILLNRLMDGQVEVLGEYVEYISFRENEIFIALFRIVQAANRYQWDVDHVLHKFSDYIPYRKYSSIFGERNKLMMSDQHGQFCSELATYYLSRKRYLGDEISMQSVDLSAQIDSEHNVIRGTISVDFEIAISDIPKSGEGYMLGIPPINNL